MAVFQLKDGRWVVKIRMGGKQVLRRLDPDTGEAIQDEEHGKIVEGKYLQRRRDARLSPAGEVDPSTDTNMTFHELAAIVWKRHVVAKKLPKKTREYFQTQLDQRIIGKEPAKRKGKPNPAAAKRRARQSIWLGDVPVNDISPKLIDKWMADMERAGHGERSINAAVEVTRLFLSKGIRWEIVTRANAAAGFEPVVENVRDARVYTFAELVDVCERFPTDQDRALAMTLALTGLRISTVMAMKRGHVRPEKGELRFYSTKGRKWVDAPLDPRLGRCLAWWMAEHSGELLFPSARDPRKPAIVDWWREKRFKPAMAAAGFPHAYPHELRHTAITRMIELGATARQVGDVVDQSSEWITLQYAKDFAKHRGEVWAKVRSEDEG